MKITLTEDWQNILKKAWSFRLAAVAALFSGLEVALPLLDTGLRSGVFAGLSFMVAVGAMAARIIAQPKMALE